MCITKHRISAHMRSANGSIAQLTRAAARIVCAGICCVLVGPTVSMAGGRCDGCNRASNTIERISRYVFAPTVDTSGYTRGVIYAARGYSFESPEDINQYNVRSAHMIEGTAQRLELKDRPIESQFWWSVRTQSGARQFIKGLAAVLETELGNHNHITMQAGVSVLGKALAQRDIVHTYGLLSAAMGAASDRETLALASQLESVLVAMLRPLLLSRREYQRLRSLLPRKMPGRLSTVPGDTLVDSYLPLQVIAPGDSWMEIPAEGKPFRHFTTHGGRSFIKVYMRAPGVTSNQLADLWRSLFQKYGEDLHVTGIEETTPAGLETMLVRTFGVFLKRGDYRDSMWPEEVTIRRFKYSAERIDHSTSDFRGTQFFQYKLSRSLVSNDPASLGLRRVLDDDWQFYGFFGDVPDRDNSYSDAVTTMRANCIACHSELLYGLSTIFSFERYPDKPSGTRLLAASEAISDDLKILQGRLRDSPNRGRERDVATGDSCERASSVGAVASVQGEGP